MTAVTKKCDQRSLADRMRAALQKLVDVDIHHDDTIFPPGLRSEVDQLIAESAASSITTPMTGHHIATRQRFIANYRALIESSPGWVDAPERFAAFMKRVEDFFTHTGKPSPDSWTPVGPSALVAWRSIGMKTPLTQTNLRNLPNETTQRSYRDIIVDLGAAQSANQNYRMEALVTELINKTRTGSIALPNEQSARSPSRIIAEISVARSRKAAAIADADIEARSHFIETEVNLVKELLQNSLRGAYR